MSWRRSASSVFQPSLCDAQRAQWSSTYHFWFIDVCTSRWTDPQFSGYIYSCLYWYCIIIVCACDVRACVRSCVRAFVHSCIRSCQPDPSLPCPLLPTTTPSPPPCVPHPLCARPTPCPPACLSAGLRICTLYVRKLFSVRRSRLCWRLLMAQGTTATAGAS